MSLVLVDKRLLLNMFKLRIINLNSYCPSSILRVLEIETQITRVTSDKDISDKGSCMEIMIKLNLLLRDTAHHKP